MRINVEQAAQFLRENDDYLILMHASPDGDTLGCGSALCGALQRMGKRAKAVCPDVIPVRFNYLFNAFVPQEFEEKTIVCVDVADTKLLGDMKETGARAALCIDHHGTNTEYAERLLLEPDYAACAELMYEVITALGVEIDTALADCIYTGTATDTGCFMFSNTTPQTHEIAAEMLRRGARYADINYAMFELKTQGRIKLEQETLKNIRYYGEGHISVITAPLDLVNSIEGIDNEDIGALATISRRIEGIEIGISIKERKPGLFKVSMRSSERIDVAAICEKFGGGGHIRAAGCQFTCPLEEVEKQVVAASEEALRAAGIIL